MLIICCQIRNFIFVITKGNNNDKIYIFSDERKASKSNLERQLVILNLLQAKPTARNKIDYYKIYLEQPI